MYIVIANGNGGIAGGIETYSGWLARALLERSHRVACWVRRPAGDRETWVPDAATSQVAASADEFARLAARERPDVVFINPFDVESEERLLDASPCVLYAHVFYGSCISGSKTHSLPQRIPCQRQFGAACLALYLPRRCGGLNPAVGLRLFLQERRRQNLLPRYKSVLAASHFMRDELVRHGVPQARVRYAPFPRFFGVPTVEAASATLGSEKGRIPCRVLSLGRLTKLKGVDLLVRAAEILRRQGMPISLDIAGDGPEQRHLKEMAAKLEVPAEFHGWVDDRQKVRLFERAAVFAFPSTWPEPFGLSGLEAVQSGVPCAAFDVGGIREWLTPGITGELAPADPPTALGLAAALARLLTAAHPWQTEASSEDVAANALEHLSLIEREMVSAASTA
jgi:glycosyltransferase involved in cell wall biosynthesis